MSLRLRLRHRSRRLGTGAVAAFHRLRGRLRVFQTIGTVRAPLGRLRGLLSVIAFKQPLGSGRVRGGPARLTGYAYAFGSSGVATQLAVTTQPSGAVSGVAFTQQPVVRLQNASGSNVVESGVIITAYLSSGTGTLGGTKQVATDSIGRATFTNLSYTGTGSFTVSFAALLSATQAIFSDDVETDKSAQYFEVETNGGNFARASVGGSTQWRAICSGAGPEFGNLKLGIGRTPSGVASVGPSGVDFGLVTMECDISHSVNNLANSQDKCLRMSVFSAGDWSQAAAVHIWSNSSTHLEVDPVTSVVNNVPTAVGWNDFAHFTWTGLTAGTNALFGATATTKRRLKVVWRLNDPGQSNGYIQQYIDGVLDAQQTGLNLVQAYTEYGINAVHWENYRTGGVTTANNRMYDNLAVTGQARAVIAAGAVTVGAGGGGSAPTPEDAGITILADYRAGGNRDLQAVSSTAQMYALFDDDSGNGQTNPVLATNFDGAGTKAMRCDWTAAGDTAPEQSCYVETHVASNAGPFYVWAKVHLGRTATGGGNGTVGVYALNENHSNAHRKNLLIQRTVGSPTNRIYGRWTPGGADHQIDTTSFNSNDWSDNPLNHVGVNQSITLKFTAGTSGRIEAWLDGTKVLDQTGANITTSPFAAVQWFATILVPKYDMSEYWWDMVIGRG